MLAKVKSPSLEIDHLYLLHRAPLRHQLESQLVRIVHRYRKITQLLDNHLL